MTVEAEVEEVPKKTHGGARAGAGRKPKAAQPLNPELMGQISEADPCGVVGGFIVALEQVIARAPATHRIHLRLHAVEGLRRASEKYRLELISSGVVDHALIDDAMAIAVEEVRRQFFIALAGGTQPAASA